ncbi:flagellar hook-length control protein FliK [Achromobacter sp. MY14]|uniref:flagellar hook-length control protein FliK n=1 Tax=Achromobacter TaxID=222 RepID=UPI000F8F9A5F|nr:MULTISPECIES: flagellar hook-length control protein FliK [Achromobacter]AZS79237.1 flagellar hook-length control protein FliK [Achromobacter spanius]MCD0497693.1 flagellar hook-length control protein FliK [Achromobacter sp. MY14]
MTAPLPLPTLAPVAKTSIADALGANKPAPANKKGPSFSDVLAQQRPKPSADSRPANDGAKTPDKMPGKTADAATDTVGKAEDAAVGAINDAVNTATSAEAGALAVAAAQPPAPALPQQTLELAAQAAEQVQLARGTAEAAAAALGSSAAVLTAALNAADVAAPATTRAPVAVTAAQAEVAAAIAARDAQVAQPVLTAAVKPGSAAAPVVAAAPTAQPAVKADAPRATADLPLPRVARETKANPEHTTTTLPARTEEEVVAALTSSTQQFQAPQHGATAQDHLAQAIAAATQRQAAPAVNQAAFAPPAVPLVMQVATPVGGTHWGTELGQQVVMMSTNARQGMQTAELRLDPPDLGPLRVSLNIADGVASASFVSAHASVRQAIETAMPQLQQALAQAGISLGQTSVGEQSAQQEFAQQQGNGGSQRQSGNGSALADASTDNAAPTATVSRNANALVDTFA